MGKVGIDNNKLYIEEIETTTGSSELSITSDLKIVGKSIKISNSSSKIVSIEIPNSITSDWTMTLPDNKGTNNQILTTDGSGITTWSTIQESIPQGDQYSLQYRDGSGSNFYLGGSSNLKFLNQKKLQIQNASNSVEIFLLGNSSINNLISSDNNLTIETNNLVVDNLISFSSEYSNTVTNNVTTISLENGSCQNADANNAGLTINLPTQNLIVGTFLIKVTSISSTSVTFAAPSSSIIYKANDSTLDSSKIFSYSGTGTVLFTLYCDGTHYYISDTKFF